MTRSGNLLAGRRVPTEGGGGNRRLPGRHVPKGGGEAGRRLAGRRALVTGGAGGIGSAIVRALATEGASVAVHYHRSREGARALAEEVESAGGRAVAVAGDLTRPAEARRVVRESVRRLGGLDILVANAGISEEVDWRRLSPEAWDRVMEVNLRGAFLCAQAAAPALEKGTDPSLVFVSSTSGLRPSTRWIPYSVSKAGLLMLSKCLALALAPLVRVNCVAPGLIAAGMNDPLDREAERAYAAAAPLGRVGRAGEVAEAVVFLASRESRFITGQTLVVDGGRAALTP